jgi:hypothetical protein
MKIGDRVIAYSKQHSWIDGWKWESRPGVIVKISADRRKVWLRLMTLRGTEFVRDYRMNLIRPQAQTRANG